MICDHCGSKNIIKLEKPEIEINFILRSTIPAVIFITMGIMLLKNSKDISGLCFAISLMPLHALYNKVSETKRARKYWKENTYGCKNCGNVQSL